jgi:DNA-binding NtrC family response regulator
MIIPPRLDQFGLLANHTMLILIVDNDRIIRETLASIISRQGDDVYEVDGLAEALLILSTQKFDLIIVDINSTDAMEIKIAEKLLGLNPDIPILILSDGRTLPWQQLTGTEGSVEVIQKPFEPNHMLKIVDRLTGTQSQQ